MKVCRNAPGTDRFRIELDEGEALLFPEFVGGRSEDQFLTIVLPNRKSAKVFRDETHMKYKSYMNDLNKCDMLWHGGTPKFGSEDAEFLLHCLTQLAVLLNDLGYLLDNKNQMTYR